jgi:hypothetical protein
MDAEYGARQRKRERYEQRAERHSPKSRSHGPPPLTPRFGGRPSVAEGATEPNWRTKVGGFSSQWLRRQRSPLSSTHPSPRRRRSRVVVEILGHTVRSRSR